MLNLGINVFWFSKEKYMPGDDMPVHSHPFFHYIYVLSGKATMGMGDQYFPAQRDEFYLTHAGSTHSLKEIEREGFRVIEIKFEVNNEDLFDRLLQLPPQISLSSFKVRRLLESMISEGMHKESFYSELIHLKFMEVLYYLIRGYTAAHSEADEVVAVEDTSFVSNINQVCDYLDNNLDQVITLEMIAKQMNMSKHYFCRYFKNNYGLSPIQYLNKKRLSRAKDLMLHSDFNITQIAGKVGFTSVHYFSRFFKKHENITPQEYKKMHVANLYFFIDKPRKINTVEGT